MDALHFAKIVESKYLFAESNSRKEAFFITTELVQLAQNGDEQAFYTLIQQEQPKLYRMAYVYVQNENDAIEVFQQTIIRAYEGLPQLKEPHYFSTWLTRIMINCCKTYVTKNGTVQPVEPSTLANVNSTSPTYIEEELDLWQALCQLEEKYKTVLLLRFYQDYSVKDIAVILHYPEGTVKTHIRRGLQALRHQLKGAYIDDWVQSVETHH
ncbi:sigma-70 family RNA polymerase sigma factor [Lysinibacillus piscis]|uniref:DNA-directed RNA polymerase sigma-70 factor n=1 Tax=Lysinibacillus piscis TaxID=2518931 RepID=A0ABQ5NKK0_9BACI|nr:sigma-70 family RNA polymerase sigma factor [Lysinibacillus sp. KH24]GLC88886.1 DNA-directed RNA polymerase sigma-70 factor [Lysinibacillus sp. KH24]